MTNEQGSIDFLIEILPLFFSEKVKAIPDQLFELSQNELEKKFDSSEKLILKRMRITFWIEADRCLNSDQKFSVAPVYSGICSRAYFNKKILGNSFALAYLLRRLPQYKAVLHEMVYSGMEYERQILDMPAIDSEGKPDYKLIQIQLKLIESAHNRLMGTPVSRTQIHQHMTTSESLPTSGRYEALGDGEIKARIKELERK